jgi:parvulin-like peptidyl-prolyl isomerase
MRPLFRTRCSTLSCLLLAACTEGSKAEGRVEAVAVVNGAPVTLEAFALELAYARRTSDGVFPRTDDQLAEFRRATREELIDRTLLVAAARAAGVTVAPERVEREILRLKAEYHGASFGEALAEGQLSPQELKERTHGRLLLEKYFADTVFAREAATEAEVETYYKAHAEEFAVPEQVRAAQIVVKTLDEARRVQGKLREGMGFDEAARRYSLSPDAKVGGDLGLFRRGIMPTVFDQTCFALPPGRTSEIVESEYGFHLFKVLERRPAEQRSFQSLRPEVERRLLRLKREEAQLRTVAQLREKANIRVDEAMTQRAPLSAKPPLVDEPRSP